ncbi:MAG: RDD family protein [Anaerolineae bacterium]|nr:RDD family protein [Anaerolineae bacterium]
MSILNDEFLNIDTPENVAFNYEVAGIATRTLAGIVDTLILTAIQAAIFVVIFAIAAISLDKITNSETSLMWSAAIFGVIRFAITWGYYVFFELRWNGQPPGKRWVGLRVIRTDGAPITLTESVIRNVVRVVDTFPIGYGVGIVTMFINSQCRRVGDLAAGTVVVRDKGSIQLESLATRPPRRAPWDPEIGENELPLNRLTAQDLQMAEDYLRRIDELLDSGEIGKRILMVLLRRMDLPVDWMADKLVRVRIQMIVDAANRQQQL